MSTPDLPLPPSPRRSGALARFLSWLRAMFRGKDRNSPTPPNIYPLY